VLIGNSLYTFLTAFAGGLVFIVAGVLLFDMRFSFPQFMLILLILMLTFVAFLAIGMLSASFIMVFKEGNPIDFLFGTSSYFLGGVFFPIEVLPRPFQLAAQFIPITHAVTALRELLLARAELSEVFPIVLNLVLFIAVLEDCGYMARAAYLMDKMMVRVGLNGKAFIPMLASFACAVPGIMAARVIENERDRLTTILVAPLMTCSARLPIYVLLIGAFIPARTYFGLFSLQGLTLVGLYALGITAAVAAAWVFKRTILRGQAPPFMMELPSYKWPSLRTILFRVAERGWVFLHTAGTMILAVSILIWAALYFPHDAATVEAPFQARRAELKSQLARLAPESPERQRAGEELEKLEGQIAGAYQRQSFLGRAGRLVEPVFAPLGWDWRISCAVIASFPAREVVVATLGVVFNLGEEFGADSDARYTDLRAQLDKATWDGSDRKVFTVPVALSIMVFFALCAQCAATLAVIRRETNSWRWPAFTFAYMTALAYVGALVTYQFSTWIGTWIGGGTG
jgi:ferrous iron transport protein B